MSKKFIKLKDKYGNTLYPSAYKDDLDQVIRKTYLTKTGKDSYIYKAWVETYESSEHEIVQKLVLVNRSDPDHPIEFYTSTPITSTLLPVISATDNVNYNINTDELLNSLNPCEYGDNKLGIISEDNRLHSYEECLSLCIDQIQKLNQKVKELEDAK